MSLLTNVFTGDRRGFAIEMWGAATGLVSGIGVLVGGILTGELDWRWIFVVNLGFSALIAILAALVLLGIGLAVVLLRRSEPVDAEPVDVVVASVTPRPAPPGVKAAADPARA